MTGGMPWGWGILLVAAGGAAGAVLRHLLSQRPLGPARGILLVNVLGAALLGALAGAADRLATWLLLLLGTGLCGALTTWSTLAVSTAQTGRRDVGRAAAYLCLTLALGLAAAWAAHTLTS